MPFPVPAALRAILHRVFGTRHDPRLRAVTELSCGVPIVHLYEVVDFAPLYRHLAALGTHRTVCVDFAELKVVDQEILVRLKELRAEWALEDRELLLVGMASSGRMGPASWGRKDGAGQREVS
jgi:hypothetical protein